jgi:hypothetical protein
MNNKITPHSIEYRNKVWYFLARPKERRQGHYHSYYISSDLKDVIDWNYSMDFEIVSSAKLIRLKIISEKDIKRLKVSIREKEEVYNGPMRLLL